MNSKEKSFILKVAEIVDNPDGTATCYFELDKEFVEWFKKDQGLKRWSQKRFQKVVNQSLLDYVELIKEEQKAIESVKGLYKHKKEDCVVYQYQEGGPECPDCEEDE